METIKVKDLELINALSTTDSIPILTDEIDNYVQRINFENFSLSLMNAKGAPSITNYANDINYSTGQWVLDNGVIYKSLVDDNIGHSTTDEDYWEEVKLGGGYHPPILSCMWSDHLINDQSWLRADTFSWQDGDVYVTAYNTLVEEYATGIEETEGSIAFKRTDNGYKIATADMESAILSKYNSDGIAWFYILDIANKRFKLPRTKYSKFTQNKTLPVTGNGTTIGVTDGSVTAGLAAPIIGSTGNLVTGWSNLYGTPIGSVQSGKTLQMKSFGLTTDSSKSGIKTTYSDTVDEDMKLYFYVGEYSQTAIEQTAGLNSELFNNKQDVCTHITKTFEYGSSGYRIWSDGYCEQWGWISLPPSGTVITLTKSYKDTNYNLVGMFGGTNVRDSMGVCHITAQNKFALYHSAGLNYDFGLHWKTCGYLAEGEY